MYKGKEKAGVDEDEEVVLQ